MRLEYQFVENIPDALREGVLYISIPYATAVHNCACGCGNEVVTPLSPSDWKLIFDGRTVSLDPSIGNWSFPCQSHYWITRNEVGWSDTWCQKQIDSMREEDRVLKLVTRGPTGRPMESPDSGHDLPMGNGKRSNGFWLSIWQWVKRRY